MFGFLKSKELTSKENQVTNIGKMLFGQIAVVRDKAKAGRINVSVFDKRMNSMFAVGYLIGYVDEHLSELFDDDKSKSKYARRIFEGIFPGSGANLVQSKIEARRIGETISPDSLQYFEVLLECQQFDTGVNAGGYEVCEFLSNREYTPNKLERYLSTGEIE
ncbi:hypothetical protein [Desulfocastanea catecholica]